jgi:HSP20 family protein
MVPAKYTGGIGSIFADPIRDFEQRWNRLMSRMSDGGELAEMPASYPVDIDEDDNHIYVEAELPGFKAEEIDVSMESGMLTIKAERRAEEKSRTKHLSERRYTRVQRSFSLPNSVDEESVDAKLEEGVLHITLNKRPESKRRKIEVQG